MQWFRYGNSLSVEFRIANRLQRLSAGATSRLSGEPFVRMMRFTLEHFSLECVGPFRMRDAYFQTFFDRISLQWRRWHLPELPKQGRDSQPLRKY